MSSPEVTSLDEPPPGLDQVLPTVVDHVALARLYGEPLFKLPQDLYIPPDALQVFLEAFEGPLDLLLYLIRKQNFNILDIPMAEVTRQYLGYVEQVRARNLELAAEYLLMAAILAEIKSRMLLPRPVSEAARSLYPQACALVSEATGLPSNRTVSPLSSGANPATESVTRRRCDTA